MSSENQKILTVSFVAAAFVTAIVVRVLLETLAATFGLFASYYALDAVKHGIPVATGLITFGALQFNKNIVTWGDEVVLEVTKVVWPSKKDTTGMTLVCCVMLIISGLVLGFFDFLSGTIVKMIVNG